LPSLISSNSAIARLSSTLLLACFLVVDGKSLNNLLEMKTEKLAQGFYILNVRSNNGNTIFNSKIIK
jgi:hypothetical protein